MFTRQLNHETELRLLDDFDAQHLFALIRENEDRLKEWVPWLDQTATLELTRSYIQNHLDRFEQNNGFSAAIWHRGLLSGEIRFEYIDWPNRATEIGYWIGKHVEGKGIVSRATASFVADAFDSMKLNRVQIRCAAGNLKSRAIPERLGFHEEGILRQAEWLGDRCVDLVVYGLLRDEWPGE